MVAEQDACAVDAPFGAAARRATARPRPPRPSMPGAAARAARSPARSDAPIAARPTPPSRRSPAAPAPFSATTSTTSGVPRVSVPVLSNATQRTRPARSRCSAALDEHALARGAGQRRDDRHRRRDDERARARHDEQHERAVDPRRASPVKSERRHDGHGRRQRDDRRRVDAREALDERLRRRALGLRPLDQVNDARQRRVAPEPRHADVERAAAVDRAGEHLVARPPCRPAATRR